MISEQAQKKRDKLVSDLFVYERHNEPPIIMNEQLNIYCNGFNEGYQFAKSEAAAEIDKLTTQRDLALAHDTQPYPTAFAYEQLCKADQKKMEKIQTLEAIIQKLEDRIENAIWFQERAKTFISHSEDCNAITEPDELEESGEPCECGMDKFAHDNYISQEISRSTLDEVQAMKEGMK